MFMNTNIYLYSVIFKLYLCKVKNIKLKLTHSLNKKKYKIYIFKSCSHASQLTRLAVSEVKCGQCSGQLRLWSLNIGRQSFICSDTGLGCPQVPPPHCVVTNVAARWAASCSTPAPTGTPATAAAGTSAAPAPPAASTPCPVHASSAGPGACHCISAS